MIYIVEYTHKYKKDVTNLILHIYEDELGFVGCEREDTHKIPEIYQKDNKKELLAANQTTEPVYLR